MHGWRIKVNFSDNIERTTHKDFLLFLDLIPDVDYPWWCRSKFLQSKMNGVNCWFNWYPSQLPSFYSSKAATLAVPTMNWRHFAITRTPTLVCSIHFRNTHSEWWRIKDQEESICHTSIFWGFFTADHRRQLTREHCSCGDCGDQFALLSPGSIVQGKQWQHWSAVWFEKPFFLVSELF